MYGEFTGKEHRGSVEILKYQGMTLAGFSGTHVLGVLISEANVVSAFNFHQFIEAFEKEYEGVLEN